MSQKHQNAKTRVHTQVSDEGKPVWTEYVRGAGLNGDKRVYERTLFWKKNKMEKKKKTILQKRPRFHTSASPRKSPGERIMPAGRGRKQSMKTERRCVQKRLKVKKKKKNGTIVRKDTKIVRRAGWDVGKRGHHRSEIMHGINRGKTFIKQSGKGTF